MTTRTHKHSCSGSRALAVLSCAILSIAPAWSQPPLAPSQPKAPPPHILYHLMFGHLNFLGQKAAEAESAGKQGDSLRRYYQRTIGLSEADHNALLRRAAACESELAKQDAADRKLMDQLRQQYPPATGFEPPPYLSQIVAIQARRDALIQGHVAQLKAEVSNAGFQKIDTFLNGEFARRASVQALPTDKSALSARRAASMRQQGPPNPAAATRTMDRIVR